MWAISVGLVFQSNVTNTSVAACRTSNYPYRPVLQTKTMTGAKNVWKTPQSRGSKPKCWIQRAEVQNEAKMCCVGAPGSSKLTLWRSVRHEKLLAAQLVTQ